MLRGVRIVQNKVSITKIDNSSNNNSNTILILGVIGISRRG